MATHLQISPKLDEASKGGRFCAHSGLTVAADLTAIFIRILDVERCGVASVPEETLFLDKAERNNAEPPSGCRIEDTMPTVGRLLTDTKSTLSKYCSRPVH